MLLDTSDEEMTPSGSDDCITDCDASSRNASSMSSTTDDGEAGTGSDKNLSGSDSEEDRDKSLPAGYAVCKRVDTADAVRTWEIVGPVGGGRVDATAFTHIVTVRAAASLSCRGAYARVLPRLKDLNMYVLISAACASLRVVALNLNVAETAAGIVEPSWDFVAGDTYISSSIVHKVLKKAVRLVSTAN